MSWWQVILILLLGVLPCMLVALVMIFACFEFKKSIHSQGEIQAQLKGLHSILNRIEKNLPKAQE